MEQIDVRQDPATGSRRRHARRKRRRPRRKRGLKIPAPMVFYATAGLAAMSSALVYLKGEQFLGFSIGSCLLILATLLLNERFGFSTSKRLRRSHEARNKFNELEIAALFVLLMLGIFVSVVAWAT